jgi:DNA-binding PadR family transcriptional regulator
VGRMNKASGNYLSKDMKHILLKVKLLHEISLKPSYPYALIERLKTNHAKKFLGKDMKNEIYNTMSALERSGYIISKPKIERGKQKNYYHITPLGKQTLIEAKSLFNRSVKELKSIIG